MAGSVPAKAELLGTGAPASGPSSSLWDWLAANFRDAPRPMGATPYASATVLGASRATTRASGATRAERAALTRAVESVERSGDYRARGELVNALDRYADRWTDDGQDYASWTRLRKRLDVVGVRALESGTSRTASGELREPVAPALPVPGLPAIFGEAVGDAAATAAGAARDAASSAASSAWGVVSDRAGAAFDDARRALAGLGGDFTARAGDEARAGAVDVLRPLVPVLMIGAVVVVVVLVLK